MMSIMNKTCVILTPFAPRHLKLKDNLKNVLSEAGFLVYHPADMPSELSLSEGISRLLTEAQIVIADISDLNPNVLYEVGLARGAGTPVLLLASKETEVPFDLAATIQLLRYDQGTVHEKAFAESVLRSIENANIVFRPQRDQTLNRVSRSAMRAMVENPFGFTASEHMDESDVIEKLFVKPPYFKYVNRPDTVLFFGPRGCGKTMLFRMILHQSRKSLENQLSAEETQGIAFYVNFNTSFRFLDVEQKVFSNSNLPAIYFNLLYLHALVNEFDRLQRNDKIASDEIDAILSVIREAAGLPETSPVSFPDLTSRVTEFISRTRQGLLLENPSQDNLSNRSFLSTLAGRLKAKSPFLNRSNIVFLLDDYADDWLPDRVSQIIKQIIFERSANCSFKIATIPGRQNFSSEHARQVLPSHDYQLISLAPAEVFPDIHSRSVFLREILNRRLSYAAWSVDSSSLFDSQSKPEEPIDYSGITNLARLCTSDVRTVIDICSRMVTGIDAMKTPIPRKIQNETIRRYSWQRAQQLRSGPGWGDYATDFLKQVMKSSLRLYQAPLVAKRSRIEGFEIDFEVKFSPDAERRLLWLLRSGLLQESHRIQRRQRFLIGHIFFPAFGIPITGPGVFALLHGMASEAMLTDPEGFWSQFVKRQVANSEIDMKSLFDKDFE